MSRHILGVSAIVAALAVLGYYAANPATARHVASLSEEGSAIAQQAPTETTNAYGWRPEASVGQNLKEQVKTLLSFLGSNSAQKEATNWSREEWQIAEKAVADHRGGAKAENKNDTNARSTIVWRPPEEIAGGRMNHTNSE
jgi:hypothetical protein